MYSYDLPGDVFGPGERRPVRTKKTKGVRKGAKTLEAALDGSHPSPITNITLPTSTSASSKKRTLDHEVRPKPAEDCVTRRPFGGDEMPISKGCLVTRKAVNHPPIPTQIYSFACTNMSLARAPK